MALGRITERLERAYRQLDNSWLKLLFKNAASLLIHGLLTGVDELTFDGIVIRLCRNRLISKEQLLIDVSGYNLHCKPSYGDVVADVGAYTGLYTVYAAKKVGKAGQVIAFEPDPYNMMMLKRNLRLNNVTNVICLNEGLLDSEGVSPFDVQGFGSHIIDKTAGTKVLNRIRTTTLDSALSRSCVKKVDFVKMDIEGAEIPACRGAVETIRSNARIHFAVASYHVVNGQQTAAALETFFRAHGMRSFSGYPQHLTTYGCKP